MLSTLHKLYIRSIASVIWLNEKIFFYPALKGFYQAAFRGKKAVTVLDIGANRWQSILFFQHMFPDAVIHSFEPNPTLYKTLVKKFNHPRIHLHETGVSSTTGTKVFYEHVLDETSGFELAATDSHYNQIKNRILLTPSNQSIQASYEVKVIALDDFIESNQLENIDIVKIDVEGHEADVLQGAKHLLDSRKVRFIQMERHYDDQYALSHKTIDDLLTQAGYAEFFRQKHGFGNFFEVIYHHPLASGN
jgi:FkbM family methyltransferase